MDSKFIPLVIGLLLFVSVGGVLYMQSNPTPTTQSTDSTASEIPSGVAIAMAEVAAHAGAESCWTVIDGSVYDLTAWISQHPGGERAILSLCGKDGTAAFRTQHERAQKQEDVLATYKIGTLEQ